MSADLLRKAAETLRDRAKAATPGPWERSEGFYLDHGHAYVLPVGIEDAYVCVGGAPSLDSDAPYIATMHPGVGLALARWLEDIAAGWIWDEHPDDVETPDGWPLTLDESMDRHAVDLARLIVGEQS